MLVLRFIERDFVNDSVIWRHSSSEGRRERKRSFAASDMLPWMWKRKAQTQAQLMPLVMRTEDGDLPKILSTFDCA